MARNKERENDMQELRSKIRPILAELDRSVAKGEMDLAVSLIKSLYELCDTLIPSPPSSPPARPSQARRGDV